MLEPTSTRNTIIATTLRLAAERPWRQVTLLEIASAAGITLTALRDEFPDKAHILSAFIKSVDDEVLARAAQPAPDQAVRDALFEVIMSRFDVLAPYKPALRSIAADATIDASQVRPLLASQQWMLEAAGIGTDGFEGAAKVLGLASVYASVFRVWLEDDDAGLARTMAALDRRLRRGERTLQRIDDICSGVSRFAAAMTPRGFSPPRRPDDRGGAQAPDTPGPAA
jgi:ubiquinone biosynthesis protein COQ9